MRRLLIFGILFYTSFYLSAKADKFRVVWVNNPSTEAIIGWNQVSGSNERLLFSEDSIATDPIQMTPTRFVPYFHMENRFVSLKNLKPNTVYYFYVQDDLDQSRTYSFKTASDSNQIPLSIIAGGDSRSIRSARLSANRMVAKLRPDCVLFSGDFTNGDTADEWKEWLDDWQETIADDGRIFPIIVARGNHEFLNDRLINIFGVPFSNLFYALNLGEDLIRIYTLNTMEFAGGAQAQWLENDLQTNRNTTWKIAQYHNAIRPHISEKSESIGLWVHWAPLFFKYGLDVSIESDSHTQKSTYPIRPDNCLGSEEGFIEDENGTVYIGEGCWGAPLRTNDDDKSWTRASDVFNGFHWLLIASDKIEVRFVKTDSVHLVETLNDQNRFDFPKGIEIWNPSNGSGEVIELLPKSNATAAPILEESIQFAPNKPNPFSKHTLIHFEIKNPLGAEIGYLHFSDINGRILRREAVPLFVGCHEFEFEYHGAFSAPIFCFLEVNGKTKWGNQMIYLP